MVQSLGTEPLCRGPVSCGTVPHSPTPHRGQVNNCANPCSSPSKMSPSPSRGEELSGQEHEPLEKRTSRGRGSLAPPIAPGTEETPARLHPVRSFLYGSLTLKCPNFSPPPSPPTFYPTARERKRVSPLQESRNPSPELNSCCPHRCPSRAQSILLVKCLWVSTETGTFENTLCFQTPHSLL